MAKNEPIVPFKPLWPGYADQYFTARNRPCGKCSRPFTTTPRWRYFCPKCRATKPVRRGLPATFSIGG